MAQQFPDLDERVHEIQAAELKRRLDDGEQITLLDTRRPADFEQWHITHPNLTAVNIPFTAFLDEHGTNPATEVPEAVPPESLVTCCAEGISSLYVAEFLAREGWEVAGLADGMDGWARLNEARPLDLAEQVAVVQFHRPSSGCLSYLLIADDEAAVVDPLRSFTDEYREAARKRGATLRYAIDTHVHADHVSGVRTLAEQTDVTPVVPAGADERGLEFEAVMIADGETLALGATSIEAVGMPGHTTEMTGYRFGDALLTGDTLFLDSVARPDLEDEDRARDAAGTLWGTLQDLGSLSGDVIIAPGHVGQTTTSADDGTFTARLGDLRERLAAFEEDRETFVERVFADLPPRPNNFEQIIALNLGRESASIEEAFELELGPNNCAVDA